MGIDPEKLQRELDSIRRMIAADPDVHDHFDINGDGQIDGAEWNAVERMVVRRLQEEARESAAARAIIARDEGAPIEEMDFDLPESLADETMPELRDSAPGEVARRVFEVEVKPLHERVAKELLPASICECAQLLLEPMERRKTMGSGYTDHHGIYDHRGNEVAHMGRVKPARRGPRPPGETYEIRDLLSGSSHRATFVLDEERSVHVLDEDGERIASIARKWSLTGLKMDLRWRGESAVLKEKFWEYGSFHIERDGVCLATLVLDHRQHEDTGALKTMLRAHFIHPLPMSARWTILRAAQEVRSHLSRR